MGKILQSHKAVEGKGGHMVQLLGAPAISKVWSGSPKLCMVTHLVKIPLVLELPLWLVSIASHPSAMHLHPYEGTADSSGGPSLALSYAEQPQILIPSTSSSPIHAGDPFLNWLYHVRVFYWGDSSLGNSEFSSSHSFNPTFFGSGKLH